MPSLHAIAHGTHEAAPTRISALLPPPPPHFIQPSKVHEEGQKEEAAQNAVGEYGVRRLLATGQLDLNSQPRQNGMEESREEQSFRGESSPPSLPSPTTRRGRFHSQSARRPTKEQMRSHEARGAEMRRITVHHDSKGKVGHGHGHVHAHASSSGVIGDSPLAMGFASLPKGRKRHTMIVSNSADHLRSEVMGARLQFNQPLTADGAYAAVPDALLTELDMIGRTKELDEDMERTEEALHQQYRRVRKTFNEGRGKVPISFLEKKYGRQPFLKDRATTELYEFCVRIFMSKVLVFFMQWRKNTLKLRAVMMKRRKQARGL